MEPDILVVDEVLAVGDADFQKKCLGKMEEVTKQDGRTIIFVSHNMAAIERLCSTVILLEKGKVVNIGPTRQIIDEYINKVFVSDESELLLPKKENTSMSFSKISISNALGQPTNKIIQNEDYFVNLEFETFKKTEDVDISLSLRNSRNTILTFSSLSDIDDGKLKSYDPGKYRIKVKFTGGFLMPDTYFIRISIHHPGTINIDTREDVFGFTVLTVPGQRPINYSVGAVSLPSEWITSLEPSHE
jgi:lipopolysaccharide transport system ATP-binding protein